MRPAIDARSWSRRWLPSAIVARRSMASPPDAQAQIDLTPGFSIPNPFDALPSPGELVGGVFEFFFKTFFGIEARVTRRAVQWLIATPVYTDSGDYGELNQLRSYMTVAGWALFTLVLTVSGVRYYASGFTSGGSYEAVEALARGGLAAGALAIYPEVFGSLSIATNYLTYGITHAPGVEGGLAKLLGAATVGGFSPLGIGTIAAVVAVVLLVLLLITKIVIATLLALLYVAAPLAIALWPLPETSWLARTWLQSLIGVLLWPVVWALCFAIFAVMSASAFTLTGSFGCRAGQAVGGGGGAVRVVQGAAAAGPAGDARRADAVGRQHRGAGARVRPRRDAHRRRGAALRASPGASAAARRAPRPGERGRSGAPPDLQAPGGQAAARARSRSASGCRSPRPARPPRSSACTCRRCRRA